MVYSALEILVGSTSFQWKLFPLDEINHLFQWKECLGKCLRILWLQKVLSWAVPMPECGRCVVWGLAQLLSFVFKGRGGVVAVDFFPFLCFPFCPVVCLC